MKQRLLVIVLIAGPLAWLLGPALFRGETLAFRDAGHYYHPYYRFVASAWGEGRVPLWNSQENMGQPLLADPTAAALYPGKLIFALPLPYDARYNGYLIAHVLLAAVNAFVAARGLGRSSHAAALCAMSYALCGSVLFQVCNAVFLIGAAWLPLAMLAASRMSQQRSFRWAAGLAAVLAMMVLGGDPQMAYHVVLIAALYVVVDSRCSLGEKLVVRGANNDSPLRIALSRLVLILASCSIALTLAAVQILPSAQWSRASTRAAYDSPRNIYQWAFLKPADANVASHEFFLGHLASGHHEESYHFSVGPWHAASLLWPNCYGQVAPVNTRWVRALPAEGRTWTPTLYMGLLPLLLALSELRYRAKSNRAAASPPPAAQQLSETESLYANTTNTWLTWTVALALLAALGWYSLGWIASEIYHAIRGAEAEPLSVGWPFGGVYWLLQTLLPGYDYFRYPAKWLVVAAMGLSLLAAAGWDRACEQNSPWLRRALVIVVLVSAVLLLFFLALTTVTTFWAALVENVEADTLFGPLDARLSARCVTGSLLHGCLVGGALWWLVSNADRRRWPAVALLAITAIDLAVAQRGLLPTASHGQREAHLATNNFRLYRRASPPPDDWKQTSSPDRLQQIVTRDESTLYPKYHLITEFEILNSRGAMRSVQHDCFLREVRRRGMLDIAAAGSLEGRRPLPRAAIAHDVRTLPPLQDEAYDQVSKRTAEVLELLQEHGGDFSVVETDQNLATPSPGDVSPGVVEHCEITNDQPELIEIRATLATDGLVVLRDSYLPGWQCQVTDRATGETRKHPILRTNRVMRGVWLPAGDYDIAFAYRPALFRWGALISFCGWAAMLLFVVAQVSRLVRKEV